MVRRGAGDEVGETGVKLGQCKPAVVAPGEPQASHGIPAALWKLKGLLSNLGMSHGENDHIKGVV